MTERSSKEWHIKMEFYNRYWLRRIRDEEQGNDSELRYHLQLKWPKLRQFIPLNAGAVVLDFGCGDGKIIKEILELNPNVRVIGLDVSDKALGKASIFLPGVEFQKIVDGRKFPLTDSSVDLVISSEVIEHIFDIENALSEISRILKVGGRLLLTTPYHGFIKNLLIVFFNFSKHFNPTGPHIRFFSKKSLFLCLTKFGLNPIIHGYFGRIYPIPHCIFVLAEKSYQLT